MANPAFRIDILKTKICNLQDELVYVKETLNDKIDDLKYENSLLRNTIDFLKDNEINYLKNNNVNLLQKYNKKN